MVRQTCLTVKFTRLVVVAVRRQNAVHVGSDVQPGSALFAPGSLSAVGDGVDGRRGRHPARPVLAAAVVGVVDHDGRRSGLLVPGVAAGTASAGQPRLVPGHGGHGRRLASLPLVPAGQRRSGPLCASQGPADVHRSRRRADASPAAHAGLRPDAGASAGTGLPARNRRRGRTRRSKLATGLGPDHARGARPAARGPRGRPAAMFCATFGPAWPP